MTAHPRPTDCLPLASRSVALPVVSPKPRPSRMSKWRWSVLIGVHVLMAIHIIQWLIHGSTVSPVEPSEAMYSIELGKINAGFVFFALALLSTLIFGRYFCGWGCHVVALQDFCAHLMNKAGVRPRPFRSRMLLLGSLLLALYMFVWPAFKRHLLFPSLQGLGIPKPTFLQDVASLPRDGFHAEFIVTDFWATFAPWYIAIPFLLVCGFATVYFMGSKAFCSYGCPYGAFFAPVDRISFGRIVVSDACHGCGHCTAACTSNVRVHQEVRDFGMVMDPGCMKCMDCVSVCPNDALSFKFAKPAVLTRPRTPEARAGDIRRPGWDLTLLQDILVLALAIALFIAYRGMAGQVPLLMAAGMSGIVAFLLWKMYQLAREPSVRLQSLQLKLKGSIRPAGVAFAALTLACVAAALWSGFVRYNSWRADQIDQAIHVSLDAVYAPGYVPDPEVKALAEDALRRAALADAPASGGIGWEKPADTQIRRAWLSLVAGDFDAAEAFMRRAVHQAQPNINVVNDLVNLLRIRGKSPDDALAVYEDMAARYPAFHDARLSLAQIYFGRGLTEKGVALAREVLAFQGKRPPTPFQKVAACEALLQAGLAPEALERLTTLRDADPAQALFRAARARALYFNNQPEQAVQEMQRATELDPGNVQFWLALSELLEATGQPGPAAQARSRAEEIASEIQKQRHAAPPDGE